MEEKKLPRHIAIIMDGNGRWAKMRGQNPSFGHREGAKTLEKIIKATRARGIEALTVFAFSWENWQRPKEEVDTIVQLMSEYLEKQAKDFIKENVKLRVIGNFSPLGENICSKIRDLEEKTKNNSGFFFNIAFSYGGRREIVDAAKSIAKDAIEGKINPEDLDEEVFRSYLYTPEMPYPDLLIRTGGELRISNFLLWEIAYAELYFTDVFWPDFSEETLDDALDDFSKRHRRYGKR